MVKTKHNKPRLSIIIPTLNEELYVGKLLHDLTEQTFHNFEVIISDSSSSDNTLKVAQSFTDKLDLKTTVVERKSAGHGRNGGAQLAGGEFLLFLDADLRLPNNFLQVMIEEQESSQADVMTSHFRSGGWHPIDRITYFLDSQAFKKHFSKGHLIMSGCVQFVKKSLHQRVGGYNPEMTVGEDIDYGRRLQKLTDKFHFVSKVKAIASNRRFKKDGRVRMLVRHLYWVTGFKLHRRTVDHTDFGHYGSKRGPIWIRRLIIIIFTVGILILLIGTWYQWQNRDKQTVFGVSFSPKYAEELGMDWQETLRRSLEELPFKHYRIMTYWDRLQPDSPLEIDFAEVDQQLHLLAESDRTATVVVGVRQPRWPECHTPAWYGHLDREEQRQRELNYIRVVVERYENDPVITSWQLENEPANRNFGECPIFDREFFTEKYELVDELSDKPIYTNVSNQSGWPLQGPVGDKIGFSIYKEAHFEAFGEPRSWSFWYVPSWWHGFRAAMTEWQHDTDSFIHELQTEPWGPKATPDMSREALDALFSPEELERNIRFANQTGMKEIWLWGIEYWLWRDEQFLDDSYIKSINRLLLELEDN